MNVPGLLHAKIHVKDGTGQVTCPQKCHSMWWDQYRPSSPPSLQCTGFSPDWPIPPWPTSSPRCTSIGCPLPKGLYTALLSTVPPASITSVKLCQPLFLLLVSIIATISDTAVQCRAYCWCRRCLDYAEVESRVARTRSKGCVTR